MTEEPDKEKKKRGALRIVSRKSTKKMLGRWKRLDSGDKSDTESQKEPPRLIMGIPLQEAVELDPSFDGIPLPAFFRHAIDYVEENGLTLEGIYRVSSPKSRLDELENNVNEGKSLQFLEAHEAAGLIKRFLRQLPNPLVPHELELLAEGCTCDWKSSCRCGVTKTLKTAMSKLDVCSRYLLAYVFIHSQNVIRMEPKNKMGLPALGLLFQTVMEMSRKLVCLLIQNAFDPALENDPLACNVFSDIKITRYVLPKTPQEVEMWECDDKRMVEDELQRQKNLLDYMHRQVELSAIASTTVSEEQLWAVQTAITALKRRVKSQSVLETPAAHVIDSTEHVDEVQVEEDDEDGPSIEVYHYDKLMIVQKQLRREIAEEHRKIAKLLWLLNEECQDNHLSTTVVNNTEEKTRKSSNEWQERYLLEEAAQQSLVEEVARLRDECAMFMAKNTMLTDGVSWSTRF